MNLTTGRRVDLEIDVDVVEQVELLDAADSRRPGRPPRTSPAITPNSHLSEFENRGFRADPYKLILRVGYFLPSWQLRSAVKISLATNFVDRSKVLPMLGV